MIGFGQDIFDKFKNEEEIKKYLDEKSTDPIEGIYEYNSKGFGFLNLGNNRLALIKDNEEYIFIHIDANTRNIELKKSKAYTRKISPTSIKDIYSIIWETKLKPNGYTSIAKIESNSLIKFTFSIGAYRTNLDEYMLKVYPTNISSVRNKNRNGEWEGNGSGIIISKSGYIVTNHHVIDDADDIEVEFILNDEIQKFNAEIVQVDKVNDLAIIKIADVNFDGVKELLYNFKTRSSDVGTKVYAFGYPMALSIMGKEIKVTDGMISSKTGFDGDITTYQITAPIQAGNSGGPLFDDKANFIGINSAKIRNDIADNVGYSIKTSYILNLIDILPKSIDLPSNKKLASLPLVKQIKEITKYVVLVKVK